MIRHLSPRNRPLTLLSSAVVAGLSLSTQPLFADSEATPVPPSIGADVPVTYFGPAPSSVEPELIRATPVDHGRSSSTWQRAP